MVIPLGGAHVRQVEFRLPRFRKKPVVTATVYSNQSPGPAFAIWDITINDLGAETQIVISAANVQTGVPVEYTYFCSILVVGEAAKSKASKNRK